jgi:hypothetical protein
MRQWGLIGSSAGSLAQALVFNFALWLIMLWGKQRNYPNIMSLSRVIQIHISFDSHTLLCLPLAIFKNLRSTIKKQYRRKGCVMACLC